MLISGGVGEDVSFDIEFVSNYRGEALLFDPTPRAAEHLKELASRYGKSSTASYASGGKQSIESYALENVNADNFHFFEFALLDSVDKVKFYEPPISSHVSYSVQNIQNSYTTSGNFIEVDAIGPAEVRVLAQNRSVDVLKLDIEGSEYQFLSACFKLNFFPNQILVEIDELHFPSIKSRKIAKNLFKLLGDNNYALVYRDGFNFTYCRIDFLQKTLH